MKNWCHCDKDFNQKQFIKAMWPTNGLLSATTQLQLLVLHEGDNLLAKCIFKRMYEKKMSCSIKRTVHASRFFHQMFVERRLCYELLKFVLKK